MDLHDYLDVLRRRWVTVTIVTLATIAAAAAATLAMTTQYTATTRLFFAVETSEKATATDLAQGSSFAEKQMTSYAEVATSPKVLDPVIDRLDLQTTSTVLSRTVTAIIPPDTVILEISVVDTSSRRSAEVANAVGDELAVVAADLSPERADGTKTVKVTTLARAVAPSAPSAPNTVRNLVLGGTLGVLLGLGVALSRHVLDTRIRGEHDVRTVTDSPLLGMIGYDEKVPDHPVILRDEPLGAPAEAVRRLRTNFQFIDLADGPRSVVITSSVPGEGKSTTSLNLAVALADAGSRVILVDADLRRPSVATSLGLEGQVGLTTVLIGKAELEDVVQHMSDTSLDILPSGRIPPNPSELLGSRAMERLLAQLTADYDVVLLDTPPLLPVTDAAVLSNLTGGALLVVGADRVHRPQLREALDSLKTAGAHLHGVVLNRIARQEAGYYTYDSGYAPRGDSTVEIQAVESRPSAATKPKRARVETTRPVADLPPRETEPVPVSVGTPAGRIEIDPVVTSAGSGAPLNGSTPPPSHRATPVGR